MARTFTTYEWALETLDDDGDIVDVDHFDTLRDLVGHKSALYGRIALVKHTNLEYRDGEEIDRTYAYVEDGELEAEFADGSTVPKTKRAEVARLLR